MKNNNEHWLEDIIHGVPEGSRHDSAVRLVGRWYGKGLCTQEVIYLLLVWNRLNLPPLGVQELESIDTSTRKWKRLRRMNPLSNEGVCEIIKEVRQQMRKKK